MRITNHILQRAGLGHIQSNLRKIATAQQQASTGLRITKASDDATGAAEVMRSQSSLRTVDQYRRNMQVATGRLTAEEEVLRQVGEALTRAKEIGLAYSSGVSGAGANEAAKAEANNLLEFAVGLGNTRFADTYLFGGNRADAPPLDASAPGFAATTPTGELKTEIAPGQLIGTSHNADEIFLQTGTLQALKKLSDALGAGDGAATQSAMGEIDAAFDGIQSLVSDVGARMNRVDLTAAGIDQLEVNLRTYQSDIQEVDLEKAFTELVGRQTAYQAALLATSRVMGMTLTDYLR